MIYQKYNSFLLLESGEVFPAKSVGVTGESLGEACFTTGMSGYQETLTDPSYASQIVTFTFPHIGNAGCNLTDNEGGNLPSAVAAVIGTMPSRPSNWRSELSLSEWLKKVNLICLAEVDTRRLTLRLRDKGFARAKAVATDKTLDFDAYNFDKHLADIKNWKGIEGRELASTVWRKQNKVNAEKQEKCLIVLVDFGAKGNIAKMLAKNGASVITVNGDTSAENILKLNPDGILLSNGPGDPLASALSYSNDIINNLLKLNIHLPVLGICLGFQLLALALGAKRNKLTFGHRGMNHPVKNIEKGTVEITSQNHGFAILADTLSADCICTHTSLFDKTCEGFRHLTRPVFGVQFHPESSPGPNDSAYLFEQLLVKANHYKINHKMEYNNV